MKETRGFVRLPAPMEATDAVLPDGLRSGPSS